MKIVLVGIRENRRTIHWPGVFVSSLIIVTLSLAGFFFTRFIFSLLGGAPAILPGILFAVFLPLGCVLGIQFRRALNMPFDQLPELR